MRWRCTCGRTERKGMRHDGGTDGVKLRIRTKCYSDALFSVELDGSPIGFIAHTGRDRTDGSGYWSTYPPTREPKDDKLLVFNVESTVHFTAENREHRFKLAVLKLVETTLKANEP